MLRVATWNVLDLFAPDPSAGAGSPEAQRFARKVSALSNAIRAMAPHVLALQEVGPAEALSPLLEALSDLGFVAEVGTPDERGIRCAILSRLPVIASTTHVADHLPFPALAPNDPSPFGARIPLRRGIPHVAVATPLGAIHVLTAHLKSARPMVVGDARSARARSEGIARTLVWRSAEALFLRGLVDEIRAQAPGASVIACGDFNDLENSPPLHILQAEGEDRLISCTSGVALPQRFTSLHGGERRQIDHVLATWELASRVVSAKALNDDLRDPLAFSRIPDDFVSDHAPLVVDFA